MVTQEWRQLSPFPDSGQPPLSQGQLVSSGAMSNQGQGLHQPGFSIQPNISTSCAPPVPSFRVSGQSNSGTGISQPPFRASSQPASESGIPQPPQSMNPGTSAALLQGSAMGPSAPDYTSPTTHLATRWQPCPPLPASIIGQRPPSVVPPSSCLIGYPVPPGILPTPPGIPPPPPPGIPRTPAAPGFSGQMAISGVSHSSGNPGSTGSLAAPGISALPAPPVQSGKSTQPIPPGPRAPGPAMLSLNSGKLASPIPTRPIAPGYVVNSRPSAAAGSIASGLISSPGNSGSPATPIPAVPITSGLPSSPANSGPSTTPVLTGPTGSGLATPPVNTGPVATSACTGILSSGLAASPSHSGISATLSTAGPISPGISLSPSHSDPSPVGSIVPGFAAPPAHFVPSAIPVPSGFTASGLVAPARQFVSSAIPVPTGSVAQLGPVGPPGVPCSAGPPGVSGHPASLGTSGSGSSTSTGAQVPADEAAEGLKTGQGQSASISVASGVSGSVMLQASHQGYIAGPTLLPQQVSPWMAQSQITTQQQPRPFPTYAVSFPTSFGQLHPSGSPQMVLLPISQSPSCTVLAPPGELLPCQVLSGQRSNNWGGKVIPSSALSSQTVGSCITSTGETRSSDLSTAIGVTSGETEIATDLTLKIEESAKQEVIETWTAHKTFDGTIYYYNSVTGQSTYDRPLGFRGEPDKITSQPTPVSWEKLSGSDWALVTTNDGKKYYYNTKTQATSWHIPAEIGEMRRKQIEELSAKPNNTCISSEKSMLAFSSQHPMGVAGGRESSVQKGIVSSIASSALDLVKRKLQDSVVPVTAMVASTASIPTAITNISVENVLKVATAAGDHEKLKGNSMDGSSSEASSDSEDEDPGPTKDECTLQFKEMLKEKGVAPFSKWEKELPKIIFDPRFKAIPSHTERRSIFEHYVRTRAEEERREKRAAQKAAIEGFKQLLEEASNVITHNTVYESFARSWGCDPRFEALEKRDREMLLNERVAPLRKKEEDRIKSVHAAAVSGFKAMLNEKSEINASSRWSRIKDSLRNDPRYKMVKQEDREALFNSYVAELRSAEEKAERMAKAKREEEEKLKEREREMRKRKEREEREMERVRAKARRKDAITAYQALLTEKIRDPQASWTESRPKLEKDPLGRTTNPELDLSDRERLFRDHVKGLYEHCVREYRALLADIITMDATAKHTEDGKNILTSWSEAKKLLKSDPRYSKVPRNEREPWWRKYAEGLQQRLKVVSSNIKEDNNLDKMLAVDSNRPPVRHGSTRR